MKVGAWILVTTISVSCIAASSLRAQPPGALPSAPSTPAQRTSYGCPTPTGVVRAVSQGDVAITVPDGSERPMVLTGRTVFYAGNARGAVVDTSGRHRDSAVRGGVKNGTGPVKSRATGEIAVSTSTASAKRTGKHATVRRHRLWTVQVAAYETFDEAQSMQAMLCGRGYQARILGAVRPYDVRVGRYPTSDAAMAVARRLTAAHMTVFVAPAE